jgi:hypothetical protein
VGDILKWGSKKGPAPSFSAGRPGDFKHPFFSVAEGWIVRPLNSADCKDAHPLFYFSLFGFTRLHINNLRLLGHLHPLS